MARGISLSRSAVWLGSAAALAIGLPILVWGITGSAPAMYDWFVPVCDAVAVVCMVAVAFLGAVDAELRRDWRSLPIVFIGSAATVMWIGHFALFPGDIAGLQGQRFNQATSTLFLAINLAVPLMLAVALLTRGGPLPRPRRYVFMAAGAGTGLGLLVVAFALITGLTLHTISPEGEFYTADAIVGVAGLIPAVIGLGAYFIGLHGDERIAAGVLAALTFSALNSISLLYLHARWTPAWYADHLLGLLPYVALLAGQLWLYTGSLTAERAAADRRRIGLDIAEAMATETDPMPVVDQLLAGVLEALKADRVTMLRLVPQGYVVERGLDRKSWPANIGKVFPLDSVVSGSRAIVREAVQQMKPVVVGGYRVLGLDDEGTQRHAGIAQSIVMPLARAGSVDWVLIAGRRENDPFNQSDVDQLQELGVIAALLIRNARLLSESESLNRAKSNFINLAAHELGTPISVIRGYAEMLADESLGPVTRDQRNPVETIRSTSTDLAERVNQLLLASRLAAALEPAPPQASGVDLVSAARDAVRRAGDRARLIGASVEADAPPGPVMVKASERDLAIILDNLLNNAMTYSHPPAHVVVQVHDNDRPELRVIDGGIGVPDGDRERIFEQFHRVDNSAFGYPSGTGLGLYISRQLAEGFGARLYLESSDESGSVFTLRLPSSNA